MNTVALTLAAIAVSTAGVAHLTATDPKRLRTFGLQSVGVNRRSAAWAAIYLPGLTLLIVDEWAAAMMWLGGMPLIGWAITVTPPDAYQTWRARLRRGRAIIVRWADRQRAAIRRLALRRSPAADTSASSRARIEELELRVAELEGTIRQLTETPSDRPVSLTEPKVPAAVEPAAKVPRSA